MSDKAAIAVALIGGTAIVFFALKVADATAQLEEANKAIAPAAESINTVVSPVSDWFRGLFGDDPNDPSREEASA